MSEITHRSKIIHNGRVVGWEHHTELPAGDNDCSGSGVVVSHNVYIFEKLRGMGLGQQAHVARLAAFKTMGYNYVLCTVRDDNTIQKHILAKNGWVRLATTLSSGGESILLMGRDLTTEPDPLVTP